ncbi:MAG TPA: hemerythrin domain-containing protein, partial [Polyangiaceae bacterium]
MKATALLKEQHRAVEKLFSQIEGGQQDLLPELANNLAGHMTIEQEIFYPAVRSVARSEISEAFEEHSVAELALKRALALNPEDEQFSARVKVLKELIQQHVKEEEGELFPKVEKKVSAADLE